MINTAEPPILVSQTEAARLLGGIDRLVSGTRAA
jgi:hypothetical protein